MNFFTNGLGTVVVVVVVVVVNNNPNRICSVHFVGLVNSCLIYGKYKKIY
jgi:hypothetical protein